MSKDILDIGYFKLARNVSKLSTYKIKVGAVIANHKPISIGYNTDKSHPPSLKPTTHAEMKAILNAGSVESLRGRSIYVYREFMNTNPAFARPCMECLKVLKDVGIRKIYYSIDQPPYWKKERI